MFEDFWRRICDSNPQLGIPEQSLRLTARELREQMRRAYVAGYADRADKVPHPQSLFGQIFGGP